MIVFPTFGGALMDITNPAPEDIRTTDIILSLSHQNRYAGHTIAPYSVGQHTVAIMLYIDTTRPDMGRAQRQAALIHDFPEYILQDMTRPMRDALGIKTDWYEELTERWEDAICLRFGCGTGNAFRGVFQWHIKPIDLMAYVAENFVMDLGHSVLNTPDSNMVAAVEYAWGLTPEKVRDILTKYIEKELGA